MTERPWIKHDGKGCPYSPGTLVDVVRRSGLKNYKIPIHAGPIDFNTGELSKRTAYYGDTWVYGSAYPEFWHLEVVLYRLSEDTQAEQITRAARIASFKKLADEALQDRPRKIPAKPEKVRG